MKKANIKMKNGKVMKFDLYEDLAPITVNNFIDLCNKKFYNGLIFHRVIPGFVIQGGCPNGIGTGDPGYKIKGEFSSNGFNNPIKHEKGVLSMARSSHPDSAGSQFFIMAGNAPYLNGNYAAFGKLIDGEEVLDEIASVETDVNDKPIKDQVIEEITLED